MSKLIYIIIPLTFISFLIIAEPAEAVTEFISTIKQSGGDYSTLASWEAAIQSNLTASTTAVYSGTGTGSLSQGNTVELFRGGTYQNATSTVVATTSSQILVQNYYNSGAPITLQSGDEWRKASSTANMFTVSGSGTQLGDTPIATAQIDGAWTSADTTAVTINGWTTDATHYVKIYTTQAARHNGKWDTGKYRLSVTGTQWGNLDIREEYVRVEGLQIELNGTATGGGQQAIVIYNLFAASDIHISHNIIKEGVTTGTPTQVVGIYVNTTSNSIKIWNNTVYDFRTGVGRGIWTADLAITAYVYNNTVVNSDLGYYKQATGGSFIAKNNIANGNTTDYSGTFDASSANNISQDATSPNTALRNKTVPFVDSTNKDFHLSSSDTSAKDAGTNLSADANLAFSDDIDGNTRPVGTAWDIGADETYGVIIIIE